MAPGMTSKEIKEYILDLEQKYPVNHWKIYGVDVWPFIRIKLYIFFLNFGAVTPKLNRAHKITDRKFSVVKKLINVPGSIINALIALNQFFKDLKPKNIIFFGSHFHRTLNNGVYFNRFFDPMLEEHQLQDKVYVIEFEKVHNTNYNQKAILALKKNLDQYKYLKKFRVFFQSPREREIKLDDYKAFYDKVIKDFPEAGKLNITLEALKQWAQKINRNKEFFIKFFKVTRPKKIIFLSYYGYDDIAAAILAAHTLKINTIDFQHGPQTNVHMAYSSWTKHPEEPYNTMPLEYWTWDQKSKENIQEWAQKTQFIKVRNVGHPYLAYFQKKMLIQDRRAEIFFSLQTFSFEEMFPTILLEFIEESELGWIFRMHPRSTFTKTELKTFLLKNRIQNDTYKIEEAMQTPLPESLGGAKLHLTNFSGCVIEAGMLNVPSLIIHASGKEIFRDYIDNKSVFYLDPLEYGFKEAFKKILDKLPEMNKQRELWEIPNPLL